MKVTKESICEALEQMKRRNEERTRRLTDAVSVEEYRRLVCRKTLASGEYEVWTEAFQAAVKEHELVQIPAREAPYWLDGAILLDSDRHIEAEGAVIRLVPEATYVLLRNAHPTDGRLLPESADVPRDVNISVHGGRWEDSGKAGAAVQQQRIDKERQQYSTTAFFLFANVDGLTLSGLTIAHAAFFATLIGNARNVVCEDISFCGCKADGLHFSGNTENVIARRVQGQVGDDLVALNMYDWQYSSVSFGPIRNVLCEDITLSADSPYKALRILPGVYRYQDGSEVECTAESFVIRRVRGIKNFKLYLQTQAYRVGGEREFGRVGRGDNLFFEDIDAELDCPIDQLPDYMNSDPVTGASAAFEVNANIGLLSLENIRVTLHRERFPQSYVLCVGPKSVRTGGREIFNPELSSTVGQVIVKNWTVNGEPLADPAPYIRQICFDALYGEPQNTAEGKIGKLTVIR